ncbi:hypothetical protein JOD82_003395 [Paenibacillus sp. 1182]|nr:hypothetical protein [Paenibacillus sp. 1182]
MRKAFAADGLQLLPNVRGTQTTDLILGAAVPGKGGVAPRAMVIAACGTNKHRFTTNDHTFALNSGTKHLQYGNRGYLGAVGGCHGLVSSHGITHRASTPVGTRRSW